MVAARRGGDNINPPPAPTVKATGPDTYEVTSRRSKRVYSAQVGPTGAVACRCPATGQCYHQPYVSRLHTQRLQFLEDPLGFVRRQLVEIARLAEEEPSDYEALDRIGRAADVALLAVGECAASERRVAA